MPLNQSRPWIIGHRGVPGAAPENTRSSFELAIRQGADLVELDLRLSADEQLVVIHDDRVDRSTDGVGRVGDLTLAELRELDAGCWMGPEFRGERIPTLAEAFEFTAGRAGVVVDLKQGSDQYAGIEKLLAGLIETAERLEDVIVITRDSAAIRRINRINPEIMTLDFRHPPLGSPAWLSSKALSKAGSRYLFAGTDELEAERIARVHDLGYRVLCSDINQRLSPAALEAIVDTCIDGIFTDHARELKRLLGG